MNPRFSYKELSELVEATSEQLVDYQMSLIATTILHDAPSQNWTSQKPFYEGTLYFPTSLGIKHKNIIILEITYMKMCIFFFKASGYPIVYRCGGIICKDSKPTCGIRCLRKLPLICMQRYSTIHTESSLEDTPR